MANTSHDDGGHHSDEHAKSHTASLEQQLRRQILLNHQLDHEKRDLELRLEETESQVAAYTTTGGGGGGARARPGGDGSENADGPDVRALEERLAQTEHELEAERAGRMQVAEQLAVALDQMREQGATIRNLTTSLDRVSKQLADADARLDLTWSMQTVEGQLTKSDILPTSWHMNASHSGHDVTGDDGDNGDSQIALSIEQQLHRQITLNHRMQQEQRDLQSRLVQAEDHLASYTATVGEERLGIANEDDSGPVDGSGVSAVEHRLVQMQCELEAEQAGRLQVEKERRHLEEQLAVTRTDLAAARENSERAEKTAFALSRRLAGALRAQNNSTKLIARLRKS